jgi:hypothetical protein
MQARDQPVLTEVYSDLGQFAPVKDSAYLCGLFSEHRVPKVLPWESSLPEVTVARVLDQPMNEITVSIYGKPISVPLRSTSHLANFWKSLGRRNVYLDITGLAHHVWAPLIKSALACGIRVDVVYREPEAYRFSVAPTEGEIFDLSERITGIAPLPGFACLRDFDADNVCFIPLLGFEGTRLAYLLEQVQPPGKKIVPIIGVPGFRLEFPFFTYLGNQAPLVTTKSWRSVRFATANNPFSLFYLLGEISQRFPKEQLKIAPIGTKPHALGAVLFALTQPSRVELVYDHPLRKKDRTEGTARVLVFHVSTFLN